MFKSSIADMQFLHHCIPATVGQVLEMHVLHVEKKRNSAYPLALFWQHLGPGPLFFLSIRNNYTFACTASCPRLRRVLGVDA
jgi:hypothetical protein